MYTSKGSLVATTSNFLPRLLVLVTGLLRNLLTHSHTLFAIQSFPDQPVTQELLVKALLATANLVCVLGPEPGRVRGEDFISQHHLVGFQIQAKLELCICDYDTAFKGVGMGSLVELDRERCDCRGVGLA